MCTLCRVSISPFTAYCILNSVYSRGSRFTFDISQIIENLSSLKGQCHEKRLNCGLGEMDWTLTIDRTWLPFSDQLLNCYDDIPVTVCRL